MMNKMKINIIGYSGRKNDEGMANFVFNLSKELSKKHEVLEVSFSSFLLFNPNFWIKALRFKADIFHFIIGPTILGLLIVKVLKVFFGNSLFIISCMQPKFSKISEKFIKFLKPDLVLVQSTETKLFFENFSYKTVFVPSGVNTKKFLPVTLEKKQELRLKYGIPLKKFIVLHVGHIKKGRNLCLLNEINKSSDYQVMIIGSTSTKVEKDLYNELQNNGCIILREYFENIQELYQLSDCYIFPTIDKLNCIEMPLSVMEASSCNLPIITSKYGDLEKIFEKKNGFYYFDSLESLMNSLERVKMNCDDIKTREMVLKYSWEGISNKISVIYKNYR